MLDSDAGEYGGHRRIDPNSEFTATDESWDNRFHSLMVGSFLLTEAMMAVCLSVCLSMFQYMLQYQRESLKVSASYCIIHVYFIAKPREKETITACDCQI